MAETGQNVTLIPAPRVPITDARGNMSREWYRFFLNLFNLTGSGSSTTTIVDLTLSPPYIDQTGDLAALLQQANLSAPQPVQLGTLSSVNQDNVGYLGFAPSPSPAAPELPGILSWDANTGTLNVGLYNGVAGQVCQQLDFYAKNTSGVTIPKGGSVMATGTLGASGNITIASAVSNGTVNAEYMIGIAAQDILANDFGYVVAFGLVKGVDTTGTSVGQTWADGDVLYFNPSVTGGLTKVQPPAPAVGTACAIVLHAASNGAMFVRMKTGEYLSDLHDVNTTGAVNGDALVYNSTSGLWVPGTPSISSVSSISFGSTGLTPATATTGAVTVAGTLAVGSGGTGATSLTGYLKGNGTSAVTASATIPGSDISGNISGNAANVTGTVAVGNGGTGLTAYTIGDLLYASGASTLASLADVAIGNALISGGAGVAPAWGKIGLTTHVSGTLPLANGGTNATTASGARTSLGLGTMAVQDANNVNITYGFLSSVNISNSSFSGGSISLLGTPLAVADGGTGASTASGARTNLGLAIGSDIVAYSHVGSGGTQHAAMVGATASVAGTAGFAPAPAAGDQTKYLKGDGTWAPVSGASGGTVTSITAGTGLTGGTITTSGTIAIDSTVATLTGTQTLTNKTLTSPTIGGTANFDAGFTVDGTATYTLRNVITYTSGSGTYTTGTDVRMIIVECVGGGGGGGGAASGAINQAAIGRPGGAGGYVWKMITSPSASYSYAVGAKGTGGAAGNNDGTSGGDTSFGTSFLLAKGGTFGGGSASSSVTQPIFANVGTGGSATGGDLNVTGGDGQTGIRAQSNVGFSAAGGASVFSSGGAGVGSARPGNAPGVAAPGYGGGGSGAYSAGGDTSGTGGNAKGGDGSAGFIRIWEFI